MNGPSLTPQFFDQATSLQVTWIILHFLWQGFAISAAVFVLNLFAWNSPRCRYAVAAAGLLTMVGSVATTSILLQPSAPTSTVAKVAAPIESSGVMLRTTSPNRMHPSEARPQISTLSGWAPIASAVYVLGVLLMFLRMLFCAVGIGRLRYRSKRADHSLTARVDHLSQHLALRMKPTLKTCERVVIPFVSGIIKPVIFLPPQLASGMTIAELDAILLHELAHIRRGDLLVNSLQRAVEALLFFHPGVWYVSRILTVEREDCCDDMVLRHAPQKVYASAMIRLAEACAGDANTNAPIAALAATGANPSQLKRRVLRILGEKPTPRLNKPGIGAIATCLLAATVAALHLQAQTKEGPPSTMGAADSLQDHPITIMIDEDGNIAKFTTDAGNLPRLTAILQQLSTDENVVIASTQVKRKNARLIMTVEGQHLDARRLGTPSAERRSRPWTYDSKPAAAGPPSSNTTRRSLQTLVILLRSRSET